jgi:hypothetical protein
MADFLSEYSKYLGPMAIGGVLGSLFGNQAPDYSNVESQLQQIPGTITPYFQPYIQAGEQSLGGLQQQLTGLLQDPGALMQSLGAGYRTSPGMQQSMMQATEAANRAAAAGGQLGAPGVQAAIAKQVQGMGEKDYGDYLNRVLGLYGTGVSGLSGLTQLGAGMSRGLAEDLAQARMSQAGLEEARMQAEQQSQASLMGGLGSLLGLGVSL